MNIRLSVTGAREIQQRFNAMPKKMKQAVFAAMQETTFVGVEFAKGVAPFYTGAVAANILNFQQNQYSWVVISRTPSSDNGFPVNTLFETGDYERETGNKPRNPNSLFFMQQTSEFMEQEFIKRLGLKVKESIK